MTAPSAPELERQLDDGRIQCLACGHRCRIAEGNCGVCRVRFVAGGRLHRPHGYVGALACEPIEKKPFFHAFPGRDALTFGMLGCDLRCSYCFPGDTMVVTDRGPMTLGDAFAAGGRVERTDDAEIAYPDGLRAIARSGKPRRIRKVFKHPYSGPLVVISPYYLPGLRCTPEHRIYATLGRETPPEPIEARFLTKRHYLAVPRRFELSSAGTVDVGAAPGKSASYIRHVRSRLARGLAGAGRASCAVLDAGTVLETEANYLIPIRGIRAEPYSGDVYNMEVEDEHNYLAEFLLVSNCQNWETSQVLRDDDAVSPPRPASARDLVLAAKRLGAPVIASSYNEPLITADWAVEVFGEARAAGLACAFISNGNGTPEVIEYLRPHVSLYKVDLKGFTDRAYRDLGGKLSNVLETIRSLKRLGFWLEIVTLLVPGWNDDPGELRAMAAFLAEVGTDVPWHVTAFHPDYKMTDRDRTPARTLIEAYDIGREAGLQFVYPGNAPGLVGDRENTCCPRCSALLIRRRGFLVLENRMQGGGCPSCGAPVPGVWETSPPARTVGSGRPRSVSL